MPSNFRKNFETRPRSVAEHASDRRRDHQTAQARPARALVMAKRRNGMKRAVDLIDPPVRRR
jgi:hypothetical protein